MGLNRFLWAFFLVCGFAGTAGCGDGRPKLYTPVGVVRLDGKAVAGASVTLFPKAGGRTASGVTDGTGSFTLSTYAPHDGIAAGSYIAVVTKEDSEKSSAAQPGEDSSSPGLMGAIPRDMPSRGALPKKYGTSQTSDLEVEVDGKLAEIMLDLKSDGAR
jgi:hypothetical protein